VRFIQEAPGHAMETAQIRTQVAIRRHKEIRSARRSSHPWL
jgi:hypothetical protein